MIPRPPVSPRPSASTLKATSSDFTVTPPAIMAFSAAPSASSAPSTIPRPTIPRRSASTMQQIVGEYSDATGTNGFLLSGGIFTTLDDPLATGGTEAFGITDAGQIVGFFHAASGLHGFLLSGGTYFTIDDPLGVTQAFGFNDAGQIVGRYRDATSFHGFLMVTGPNPPPPAGTTADMILRHGADGLDRKSVV